jgi:hypothetical protein
MEMQYSCVCSPPPPQHLTLSGHVFKGSVYFLFVVVGLSPFAVTIKLIISFILQGMYVSLSSDTF